MLKIMFVEITIIEHNIVVMFISNDCAKQFRLKLMKDIVISLENETAFEVSKTSLINGSIIDIYSISMLKVDRIH